MNGGPILTSLGGKISLPILNIHTLKLEVIHVFESKLRKYQTSFQMITIVLHIKVETIMEINKLSLPLVILIDMHLSYVLVESWFHNLHMLPHSINQNQPSKPLCCSLSHNNNKLLMPIHKVPLK